MLINQKFYRLSIIAVIIVILSTCVLTCSDATEGGSGAYSNGADDFNVGRLPPAGTYYLNYFNYHQADTLKDTNGHTIPVNFSYEVIGNGFRFLHVTGKKFLGADIGMYAVPALAHVHVTYLNKSESKSGLADMAINPFVLGWHFTNWHVGTGMDIKLPTGRYSSSDIANTSRNYWTFEPIFAFTYQTPEGYESSAKFMYDFNTENSDTHYLSGQEAHVDYTFAKKIENFTAGVGGYFYKQITDDKVNDHTVKNYKGRVFAVGPQLRYQYNRMAFIFKYQWETFVENRSEGEKIWFKIFYRF